MDPSTHASVMVSYTYDALNRPVSASWDNAPAQTAPTASSVTFTYGYDPNNRRVSQTATDNTWLSSPSSASSTSYTSNALNQYTAVGSDSLTYSPNGHLAAGPALDRQPSASAGTINFVTDAQGREIAEYDGSNGTILRWYAYGLGPNEVLAQMDVQANTRKTLIPDVQGSIIATLDSGTGALSKQGYQTYGESGNAAAGFAYSGQRLDVQTGLYYYRARTYSPALGRFLQTDPIGYAGGMNLYAYVGNDPLNLIDPSGLVAEQIGSAVNSAWNFELSTTAVPHLLPSCIDPESCIVTQEAFGTVTYNAPLTLGPDVIAPTIGLASVAIPAVRAGGLVTAPVLPATLRPYGGPGGGHHVPASSAFRGAAGYDANAALAIPNSELARLGVSHSAVTGAQMTGYRALTQSGASLTWEGVVTVETNALVRGGMSPATARATVDRAIQALQEAGVAGPTRIPWGF